MIKVQAACLLIGRSILGLYFLVPGIMKFISWDMHVALMERHNMILVPYLLGLAAITEIALGAMLLINYKIFYGALLLVGLVVLVNFNLHDFWNYTGAEGAHELQNFIKNTGIAGGLLVLAAQKNINV